MVFVSLKHTVQHPHVLQVRVVQCAHSLKRTYQNIYGFLREVRYPSVIKSIECMDLFS